MEQAQKAEGVAAVEVAVVVEGREGVELMEQKEAGQWVESEVEAWPMIGCRCQHWLKTKMSYPTTDLQLCMLIQTQANMSTLLDLNSYISALIINNNVITLGAQMNN